MHKMCNILTTEFKERGDNRVEILKEFRESMKLTQNEFAENIGISTSFYIKIELGTRKPSREFISKLKNKYPQFDTNNFF